MSTAVRCWWADLFPRERRAFRGNRRSRTLLLPAIAFLLVTGHLHAQTRGSSGQQTGRRIVEAAIQALGGSAWLDLRTLRMEVATAKFFQGNRTGAMGKEIIARRLPGRERIDLDNGKVVRIIDGDRAWEVTYKGKKPLSPEHLADALRWRDHSPSTVLRRWARDPSTVFLDRGQSLDERRLIDKVTLVDSANDAVTLTLDAETHLPVHFSFMWRDPRFHDKNLDAVEYDDYERIDGIATPLTVTWTHNGVVVRERFVHHVEYNPALPPDEFNPDVAAAHLK